MGKRNTRIMTDYTPQSVTELQPETPERKDDNADIAEEERRAEEEEAAEEEEDREEYYARSIAETREQEEDEISYQAESLLSEGRSFGHPSLIKYFVLLFVLAVPNDLIDALELTGLGVVLSWMLSFFLSVLSVLFSWFTDHEQKRAEAYMKKLETFQNTVAHAARTITRIAKLFKKNPTIKIGAGAILEFIPFISVLPWSSLVVILAYLDERKTYKHAQDSGQSAYKEISENITEMV